jgi:hypothetical protein
MSLADRQPVRPRINAGFDVEGCHTLGTPAPVGVPLFPEIGRRWGAIGDAKAERPCGRLESEPTSRRPSVHNA